MNNKASSNKRGPGQPRKTPTQTLSIRATQPGIAWLKGTAKKKGHSSVGKWADAEAVAGKKTGRRGDLERRKEGQ